MSSEPPEIPAEGLPPAAFGAWFLRRDQAEVLVDALEEDLPDGDAGAIYMRSGTRFVDGSATNWSVCFDDDLEHHAREVANSHLAQLSPEGSGEVPVLWADMRNLGADGRPAQRNEPCLCGSRRKAKKCTHVGPPLLIGHAYLIDTQSGWGAFRAAVDDPRWDGAPELIPPGMFRVAAAYETVDGTTVITTTVDSPGDADPADAVLHADQALSVGLDKVLPFLAHAEIPMTIVDPDENPGQTPTPARLVLFEHPDGLTDVEAVWWSWVGMPASQAAAAIPPPVHSAESRLPAPRPDETMAWIAWGSDVPPKDPKNPPPMETVMAIAVGYSGEATKPPPSLVRAHERRYQEIVDGLERSR